MLMAFMASVLVLDSSSIMHYRKKGNCLCADTKISGQSPLTTCQQPVARRFSADDQCQIGLELITGQWY
jgi:hypothetical protein